MSKLKEAAHKYLSLLLRSNENKYLALTRPDAVDCPSHSDDCKSNIGIFAVQLCEAKEGFKIAALEAYSELHNRAYHDTIFQKDYDRAFDLFGEDLEDCQWTAHEVAALVHLL